MNHLPMASMMTMAALALCAAMTPAGAADMAAQKKPVYVCQMASHAHMAGQPVAEYDKPGICPTDGMELIDKSQRLRVAVLIFNGVQDIDYSGPMEVFGQSGATIFTVAGSTNSVQSAWGLKMTPDYDIEHAPQADIVVVPGGDVRSVIRNPKALDWIRARAVDSRAVLSVCTGAFIMGKAGLLDGQSATTIVGATEQLATMFPRAKVVSDRRYVDNGKIVTTGGLSSGIDGALHMVYRELGPLRAESVARGMEYEWREEGKLAFGQLAAYQMPDVAEFVPKGAMWERLTDTGDVSQWEVGGRIELAAGPSDFLDQSATKMRAAGWLDLPAAGKLGRGFTKTSKGRTWQVAMAIQNADGPAVYKLTIKIKQVGA
ncbi:DJ-1/PfpI family protein [Duganella violaceipulchra]|uniref:DJ-1/PfpI family protein n=1 Tax=Duganella violaceipulchra TaxID=2849652 RepID=A0AA41H9B3_9BURK|nr:DJ-1/PfpI family protein [Duganella violaceicalia]MBV6319523.1 DJ-1/PfpI family protein [Duganella violaceicalia]MCP2006664.1 putative intracellular protease/amidase [Duganella violaceicalia]